ncbi:FecCD family ABC transporter permease [Anaerobranca gottschalkii]|uniref:Iron complex transport system permease protein n=1 Tax=Anaerobranca gottschalkii DSM 13577 TaxID=1120990 RepID=A0A1I0A1V2_9FIRM|nr:iron chelate uptake ABC transporter family permease subunit [Anaerobranca gottschalkii]SES88006.1 iron complex transport system permease protein [Anaerobranca gottschalkii DSM 13577]
MSYIEKRKHYKRLFLVVIVVLLFVIVYASTLGAANITFNQSLRIIAEKIPILNRYLFDHSIPNNFRIIIWKIRLPRIFLAGLVGMGLSVVGATFQGMFKNPMAEPYVLGISSGAALGATIGIILGLENYGTGIGLINIFAFIGAISTVTLVYNVARIGFKVPTISLLLAGIAISSMMSSLISILMIFNRDKVENIVFWIMGSVSAASWRHIYILAPVTIVGSGAIYFFAKNLNILMLGEESAQNLGVEVDKTKKYLLILSTIIVAFTVSVSGIIGFVGLIVPHGVRMLLGPDHRVLIPFTALIGSIFLIITDTIARTIIAPSEIPVGAVTAVLGSPYFLYLLYKTKKKVG